MSKFSNNLQYSRSCMLYFCIISSEAILINNFKTKWRTYAKDGISILIELYNFITLITPVNATKE